MTNLSLRVTTEAARDRLRQIFASRKLFSNKIIHTVGWLNGRLGIRCHKSCISTRRSGLRSYDCFASTRRDGIGSTDLAAKSHQRKD